MARTLTSEITIDAPPETVWAILTDLESYADWNPFVVEASGTVSTDSRIRVTIQPPGRGRTAFRPRVTVADAPRTFEWLGSVGVRGIFDGRHRFELTPLSPHRTRLVQSETFTGILVPMLMRSLDAPTRSGFAAFNEALKDQAEAARQT